MFLRLSLLAEVFYSTTITLLFALIIKQFYSKKRVTNEGLLGSRRIIAIVCCHVLLELQLESSSERELLSLNVKNIESQKLQGTRGFPLKAIKRSVNDNKKTEKISLTFF